MIHFNSVSKAWPDGTHALRNVSIEIPRGQFCVVLGPSGAGKSTLLRTVNGLTKPTHGSVSIDGVQMCPASEKVLRQRVAMIHQHFNLTNRMTVAGNVLAGMLPAVSTMGIVQGAAASKAVVSGRAGSSQVVGAKGARLPWWGARCRLGSG